MSALSNGSHQGRHRPAAHAGQVRLSTDDLDGRDRFAIWREIYSRHLFNVDIEPLSDEPFRAEVVLRALPGANVVLGSRSATRTSITRPLLQTASDSLVLAVTTKGRSQARQLGREETIPEGGAVLMSSAEIASHTLEDDGVLLSIAVPKATIVPYVGDIGSALMRPFTPEADALRLLIDYARSAMALGETASPELQGAVAQHLRDLVAVLLGARNDAREFLAERGVRAARLRGVKAEVLAQLGRDDLSAETVALSLRISANYVRKLLQTQGLSFSEYVLGLRLERSFAMLRDQRLSDRAISSIAMAAGFSDISYFNRSFRRRFGMTPSEAKNQN
ncbi:AraC family transcriptional regulator [Bosea sp. TAB14]|uniref:helix-turn-helix transcriptional regulator n=1 Tax=Bosea sp. TAB14 TaxID=3237481 RepID=UPI003F8E19EF